MQRLSLSFLIFFNLSFCLAGPAICDELWLRDGATKEKSLSVGEKLVKDQIDRLNNSDSWKALNVKGYIEAIRLIARRDPVFEKLVQIFDNKQYTFAMDRGDETRLKILKSGFLNIHQTDTSAGVARPENRAVVESQYLGIKLEEYNQMPPEVKPKSTYLVPDASTGIKMPSTHYYVDQDTGINKADTWVFDLNSVEATTLFTIGDSYDRVVQHRFLTDRFGLFPEDSTLSKESSMDYVLPLNYLVMSVPFYYEQLRLNNEWKFADEKANWEKLEKQIDADYLQEMTEHNALDLSSPDFDDAFFVKFPELKPFKQNFLSTYDTRTNFSPQGVYVEGLVYGQLPAKLKVKKLIIRTRALSEEELKIVKENGIEIIDLR